MKKALWIGVVLLSVIYALPIFYTILNSFMTPAELAADGLHWIPQEFNLQQYYTLITDKAAYFQYFLSSVKITSSILVGQIILGICAAYALAKLSFPGSDFVLILYILIILLPYQVTLVPNYLVFEAFERTLNLTILDTHLALILPGVFSTFGIFLLRQFMRDLPKEIIEAAKIDGAGHLRILTKIVLPLLKPAIFALVILTFIDNWNIVDQALVFIDTPENQPLSVFLRMIYEGDFDVFYAGATLYIIPAVIIFIKGEKYLSEGLVIGGSK